MRRDEGLGRQQFLRERCRPHPEGALAAPDLRQKEGLRPAPRARAAESAVSL